MHPTQELKSLMLIDVQKQFELWRADKTASGKIPASLWELVAKLLSSESHKRTAIGRALGISTKQFRDKFPEQFKLKPKSKSNDRATGSKKHKRFVQASLDALIMSPLPSPIQLTIERNNGTKLILPSVSQEQFSVLIKTFME